MSTSIDDDRRHRPRVNIVNSFQGSIYGFTDNWSHRYIPSEVQTSNNQSRIQKPSLRRRIGGILLFSSAVITSLSILLRLGLLPRLRIFSLFYDCQNYLISWTSLLFQNWQTWDWGTVLAASIGVGGFIMEQRTGRQTELRQLHINRAQDQMNDLLVPINIAYNSLMFCLHGFLGAHLEEAGAKDDVVLLEGEGIPFEKAWDSFSSVDEVLYSWPIWWTGSEQGPFVSSTGKLKVAAPCEIPLPLFHAIQADSSSALAHHYRLWIRNEWYPGVQIIADIILRSGHLLEALPTSQLRSIYNEPPIGRGNWKRTTRGMFFSMWLSYTRAWDTILQEWDDKNYCRIRPTMPFPCGLFMFVVHGQNIVAELQKELTGQSQMHGSRGIDRNDA